jgi:tryptophan 7-halogenase
VLMGQGLTPESYHPVADAISEDELRLRLTKIRTGIQKRIDGMQNVEDFIRANCSAPDSKLH